MPLLNESVSAETRSILAGMREPVEMTCFTQAGCEACQAAADLAREVAALSPALRLRVVDLAAGAAEARRLGIGVAPTLALQRAGEERAPVRFLGLPSGHEFGAFLRTLLALSTGAGWPGVDAAAAAPIARPIRLSVFVLPGCPRCPEVAFQCTSIAVVNPHVTAEVVIADAFPDLAVRYRVGAVPLVVVDGTTAIPGVLPAPELIARIARA